VTICNIPDPN